ALGKATKGGEGAPDDGGYGDDLHAVAAFGEAGNGKRQCRIEDGEGQSRQRSELPVRKPEIALQGLGQDIDNLAVEEVQREDEEQNGQRIAPIARREERWAYLMIVMAAAVI